MGVPTEGTHPVPPMSRKRYVARKTLTETLAALPLQPTISQKSRTSASGAVTFGLWLAAISK